MFSSPSTLIENSSIENSSESVEGNEDGVLVIPVALASVFAAQQVERVWRSASGREDFTKAAAAKQAASQEAQEESMG